MYPEDKDEKLAEASLVHPCQARVEFVRRFTDKDVADFRALSRDRNNIHSDAVAARNSLIGGFCLPGLLSATMFSAMFGSVFPGDGTVYFEQSLHFRHPMFVGRDYLAVGILLERWPDEHKALYSTTITEVGRKRATLKGEAIVIHLDKL